MKTSFVIVRDEAMLYRLRGSPDIPPDATLVLDRRAAERRRQIAEAHVERRTSDRRRRADVTDAVKLDGFAVVDVRPQAPNADDALA